MKQEYYRLVVLKGGREELYNALPKSPVETEFYDANLTQCLGTVRSTTILDHAAAVRKHVSKYGQVQSIQKVDIDSNPFGWFDKE